jgi:hypothetical protein
LQPSPLSFTVNFTTQEMRESPLIHPRRKKPPDTTHALKKKAHNRIGHMEQRVSDEICACCGVITHYPNDTTKFCYELLTQI